MTGSCSQVCTDSVLSEARLPEDPSRRDWTNYAVRFLFFDKERADKIRDDPELDVYDVAQQWLEEDLLKGVERNDEDVRSKFIKWVFH